VTQLPYHENTITPHMTDYHAFRKIALGTPAIIIEVGFISLDRELLTTGADLVSDALVDGILCYLDSQ
jgi:N-acetylmuramoyl-L-alanine amidase